MSYATLIREIVPAKYDARHIEAYIRSGHPTLGHLSREQFESECHLAAMCVDAVGPIQAERAAKSWGL